MNRRVIRVLPDAGKDLISLDGHPAPSRLLDSTAVSLTPASWSALGRKLTHRMTTQRRDPPSPMLSRRASV
jgi:hypothetical protein